MRNVPTPRWNVTQVLAFLHTIACRAADLPPTVVGLLVPDMLPPVEQQRDWLNTLETNSTWSLDYKTSQLGDRIKRQISKADKDKNGYLDKEEFADLVERLQQATTCQVNIKNYLGNQVFNQAISRWT